MKQSIVHIKESLAALYSDDEINAFIGLIADWVCGWNITQFLLNKNTVLNNKQRKKIEKIVERLKKNEPIQYIFGRTEFYTLAIKTDKNVLIPRPETEELVDWIIAENKNLMGKLLDIGTGSGCIAIALAKYLPQMEVSAVDISAKALNVAHKNADENGVKVFFVLEDILEQKTLNSHLSTENFQSEKKFDIIVSNPPYVLESEKKDMQNNVLQYEPHQALFVPNENPLLFYEAIANFAHEKLNSGGMLYFEINRMFGAKIAKMLDEKGFFSIKIRKDLQGNDRMIKCRK